MITTIIISGIVGLIIGFACGVNITRHNESTARKLLQLESDKLKLATEAINNVNIQLTNVAVISSEKRVKESIVHAKSQLEYICKHLV